jgi:hypothetical protein
MSEPESLPQFLFLKQFQFGQLAIDMKGQTWVFWQLTEYQKEFLTQKIFWLTCFWKYDFCGLELKRPHLTCARCMLRRVITGKHPLSYPIHICQVWSIESKRKVHAWLFKNLLSLAEAFS